VATLTRRTPRREEVERRVLEATEELLREGAQFAELNVERIATRAGISRPAFYFYFRDKRELLVRLTESVADELYAQADAWWSSEGDGEAELRESLRSVIELYREHGVLLRAVVETAAYDESTAGAWRAIVGRFVEATRRRIEAEQAAGRASAQIPAQDTAFALAWMTERTCYQRLAQGADPTDPELLEALTGLWLRAVYGRI